MTAIGYIGSLANRIAFAGSPRLRCAVRTFLLALRGHRTILVRKADLIPPILQPCHLPNIIVVHSLKCTSDIGPIIFFLFNHPVEARAEQTGRGWAPLRSAGCAVLVFCASQFTVRTPILCEQVNGKDVSRKVAITCI